MTDNRFGLRNTQSFIINPELEPDPSRAREEKKLFLLSINEGDLKSDKMWNRDAIRALATGLVTVGGVTKAGKKSAWASVDVLIERLGAYIEAERALVTVAAKEVLSNLVDVGLDPESILKMVTTLSGNDLVNELERAILLQGYQESTIVKTVMPDMARTIEQHYNGDNSVEVVRSLRTRFLPMLKRVNEDGKEKVQAAMKAQKPIKLSVLQKYVESLVERGVETLGWKELSVCLAFATGRRMAEVHGVGTSFEKTDNDHFVTFSGQLKTKERTDVGSYIIPTLLPVETVLAMHQRLRELGKASFTPEEVHKKLSKPLSSEMPQALSKVLAETGVGKYKDLRDVYATTILRDKPKNMATFVYIAQYLGHGEKDDTTAHAYQKFYLEDEM